MKVILVYNSDSGSGSSLNELRALFAEASIEIIDSIELIRGFEAKIKKHTKQGEIIAVVGGDGSISTVAHLLVDTKSTLMPLPGGTLNHFSKDLGIPQTIPDALAYFKKAKSVKIDVGRVNNETFINNSSIGIYSDSLFERDRHQKIYGKLLAIISSAFVALFRFRTYSVELNDKKYSTPLIFIGNNEYEKSGLTFQRRSLNEKLLSVYMVIGSSRIKLLLAAISLAFGKRKVPGTLKYFTTKTVTISTRRSVRVSRDGEHEKLTSPLTYKVQESSLRVLRG